MNDLSPPSLDPAQGADVLATIRRLLAQDASSPEDDPAREGALRRRLIGTRRRDAAMVRRPVEDVLSIDAARPADPAFAALPEPLRLAEDQRVAVPVPDDASPAPDEGAFSLAGMPAETMPASAVAPDASSGTVAPAVEEPEAPLVSMPPMPREAASGILPPLPEMSSFLHDVPNPGGAASGAWPFAATHPGDRLRELLTFQAWIAEPQSDAEAPASVAVSDPFVTEPQPQFDVETEALAPALTSPETPTQDPVLLQVMIRETLLQELAGEIGTQLGGAIQQLIRDAIARALTDVARGMAMPEASGRQAHE